MFVSVPQRVLLMDEISTGLDSATTYTVTDYLRTTTHYLHLTTLVSLLQPPPEVLLLLWDTLCFGVLVAACPWHMLTGKLLFRRCLLVQLCKCTGGAS